jgi:hypothetical protein
MKTVASGSFSITRCRVELRQPDDLASIEQRAVQRHEEAMDMKDRQRVDQHVTRSSPSSP